jgi:hypothetical protein
MTDLERSSGIGWVWTVPRHIMSPPLRLSLEQDDADGIAVDHFNHAIVRGNARDVLLRLDDDPLPGFLLHGRIAGLDEDLFAVLAQAAPAAANVAAPGPPLEYGRDRQTWYPSPFLFI